MIAPLSADRARRFELRRWYCDHQRLDITGDEHVVRLFNDVIAMAKDRGLTLQNLLMAAHVLDNGEDQ